MRAILDAFAPLGVAFDEATYYTKYVAYSDKDLFPLIARDYKLAWTDSLQEATLQRKWASYDALVERGHVGSFEGTLSLIREAHAANVPMAVCSAAVRRDIIRSLDPLGITALFRTIVSADDVRVSKPNPAPYLLACQRLGLAPVQCVAIEDSPGGLASALAAGLACIAVCHTVRAERLAGATKIIAGTAGLKLEQVLGV